MGGMAWGGVRFPSPHCVSVCLIQSKNWRGSRLNSSDCWMIPSILSKLGAYNLAKVETQGFNLGKSGGDRCRGRRGIRSIWPKCQWCLSICGFLCSRAHELGLPAVVKTFHVSRNLLLIFCFLKMSFHFPSIC